MVNVNYYIAELAVIQTDSECLPTVGHACTQEELGNVTLANSVDASPVAPAN